MDKWCEHQTHTQENPKGWDCIAHLADGRIFACLYTEDDIREVSPGRFAPASDPEEYIGVCEDYKPIEVWHEYRQGI